MDEVEVFSHACSKCGNEMPYALGVFSPQNVHAAHQRIAELESQLAQKEMQISIGENNTRDAGQGFDSLPVRRPSLIERIKKKFEPKWDIVDNAPEVLNIEHVIIDYDNRPKAPAGPPQD